MSDRKLKFIWKTVLTAIKFPFLIYIGLLPFIIIFGFARGMHFLPIVVTLCLIVAIIAEVVNATLAAKDVLFLENKDMISILKGKE
jgi:hypothetical protein